MMFTTPPMAEPPYSDEAGPFSTSTRSMLSGESVVKLVDPEGRPSISTSVRGLIVNSKFGRMPRRPMPASPLGYWITSTLAFFLSWSMKLVATVSCSTLPSTTSIEEGTSSRRCSLRVAVTTTGFSSTT